MRRVSLVMLAAVLVLLAGCAPKQDIAKEKAAIRGLINTANKAFDSKDIDGYLKLTKPTLELYDFTGEVMPIGKYRETMEPLYAEWTDLRTEIRDVDIHVSGNVAWAKYRETFTFKVQGNPVEMKNLITVAFEKVDDQWKIAHFHMSTSTPPPTGPEVQEEEPAP
ncbi:MAG: nuclear transport factor 2 family protein [bacterium]